MLLAGCAPEDTSVVSVEGALEFPTSTTVDGATYTLSPARFQITGVSDPTFSEVSVASDVDIFRENLSPGDYEIELLPGWVLSEDGTPISAVLESENPVPFTVEEQAITPVEFSFGFGELAIAFGNGLVVVGIDVIDRRGDPDDPVEPIPCADASIRCDDLNPCTDDLCDEASGSCSNTAANEGAVCDAAGVPGVCDTGTCVPLCADAAARCDDGSPCTSDTCDDATGACAYNPTNEGAACNAAGVPGVCSGGACVDLCADQAVRCGDDNDCTDDLCDPATGVCSQVPTNDGASCGLGGASGVCSEGLCEPVDATCGGTSATNGNACVFVPELGGAPGVCFDGVCGLCFLAVATNGCLDNNPCTDDTCEPASGVCINTPTTEFRSCGNGGFCRAGQCDEEFDPCISFGCPSTGNPCTVSECVNGIVGCEPRPVANGTECGPTDVCIDGDCINICEGVVGPCP